MGVAAVVEHEVLREPACAVVVVAEVFVEVGDDRGLAPPRDRHEEIVEEADHGDRGCRADDGPDEPDELLAPQDHGTAEKVRPDRNEIVLQREPDRGPVGSPPEPILRENRVHAHDRGEDNGEDVGDVSPKGEPAGTQYLASDSSEGDAEQKLLPGLESCKSAAANTGAVQRRHDRVVRGQADDPRVQREDRPAPDKDRGGHEQDRIDRDRKA